MLPPAEGKVEPLDLDDSAAPPLRGAGSILVVDDEESIRQVASRILERAGFSVVTAADGQQALEVFRAHAHEMVAVVLDLTMPIMGGEETFRELRAIRAETPVILSSGYGQEEIANRMFAGGLAGFLEKPYTGTTLLEKLRQVLPGAVFGEAVQSQERPVSRNE
jgi:CheY-like chemotaxis protein